MAFASLELKIPTLASRNADNRRGGGATSSFFPALAVAADVRAACACWFVLDGIEGVRGRKLATVPFGCTGFEKPEGLAQVIKDRLVVWIGNLGVEVFHAIDERTKHFLTVCAGVATEITRIAGAVAFDERQHFGALALVAFDVQHVQPISMTGVEYSHAVAPEKECYTDKEVTS
jgi:hypothetical protein